MTDEAKIPKDGQAMDVQDQMTRILRDNAALFQQLTESERRFRRLAKAVWAVQEDERRRVARELHDSLGQTLTALKIQIEVLAQNKARSGDAEEQKINEALALAVQALNDARELSHLLRPQVLDDLGLVAALQWLCRTIKERTGFEVTLKIDEGEDRLDPELETAVFRIVQEGLTNAMKHSGVSRAEVRLRREGASLHLLVTDGGQGLPRDLLHERGGTSGAGLANMRDRAESVGGHFRVGSAPGMGTTVEVILPLTGEGECAP